jgi:hypothetical protein
VTCMGEDGKLDDRCMLLNRKALNGVLAKVKQFTLDRLDQ